MVLIEKNGILNRAKIVKADKNIILLFCVDSGQLVTFKDFKEDGHMIEITDNIINFMPFQVCSSFN